MAEKSKKLFPVPQVLDFHDYRAFLKAWFEFGKNGPHQISLRDIAKEIEASPSYLSMILSGQRKISDESLEKLFVLMKFTDFEKQHFHYLRTIADSESQAERIEALAKLQKVPRYKDRHQKELEVYKYLTNWYYVAIREAVNLPDFRLDPKWIQKRLKFHVSISDIQVAIDFLLDHEYIKVDKYGKSYLPEKQIDCMGGVYKMALAQFHKELFSLASQSIDQTSRDQRNITFHTMAFPKQKFEKLREVLDNALKEVAALGACEKDSDSVYHITFACFPLAQEEEDAA
ncbi:MAG: TIGR02147 family protein [Bdellovibrionia bacterium]